MGSESESASPRSRRGGGGSRSASPPSQPGGAPGEQIPLARPTLREVARLAGLSVATVSRVINGEAYFSEDAAAKVHEAAAQLGFRVNVFARELRSGASTTVGLMIGDLANPFWSGVARGVEREVSARGLRLLTASTDEDPALEWSLTQDMLDRRVRALLVVPSAARHRYLEQERRQGLPIVFVDRPPLDIVADTILLDNSGGARAATEHLLDVGHRRIGVIGDMTRLYTHRCRVDGVREAMGRAGVNDWELYLRDGSSDAATAEVHIRELLALPMPPTALFTLNNWVTAGALRALRTVGGSRALPALVGFDDFDLADLLHVSVVRHSPEEMGRMAARVALARMDGDEGALRTVILPTELVPRGSGERPPAVR